MERDTLSTMTAEEREHLREELVRAFLELKFSKETELTFLNERKINGQLIPLLRGWKYEELQKDVEAMYCLYANVIDYKDNLIEILSTQLEDAAMQDARALSHHYDILSDLVGCFNYRAEKASKQFKNQKETLHGKLERELNKIQSKHTQEMKEIEESESAKTTEFEDKTKRLFRKYERMSNEIKEKMVDEKQSIKAKMEPEKKRLIETITEAHDNYLKATNDRRRLYEELKAKDDKHTDEIERTMQQILSATDNIKKLEKKVNDSSSESATENAVLRQERDKLKKQKVETLTELRINTEKGQKALKALAKHSEESLLYLQHLVKKAEEILRIKELCAKLELEDEKIYPFYRSRLTQEECDELTHQTDAFKLSQLPDLEETKEYYKLEKYFKVYNKVQLDNFILEKELEDLNMKNQQLRNALKEWFHSIPADRNILQGDCTSSLVIAGSGRKLQA